MQLLFKDGLGLDGLELGLEVLQLVSARVGSAASIREIVGVVFQFVAFATPMR